MAGKIWSETDKDFVKANLDNMSTTEIAEKLGRTRRAVQHLCNNMGWEKSKPKIGDIINRLRIDVIYIVEKYNQQISIASCTCVCGNKKDIKLTSIVQGTTQSCGCLKNEKAAERTTIRNTKHGLSRHPLFVHWLAMKARCYDEDNIGYKNYGERGIKVCNEWLNDFQSFYNWASQNGYKKGLSLDRIDNNGNYEPQNCKWSTFVEQANNRSSSRFITAFGESKTIAQWMRDTRCKAIGKTTIFYRIKAGWNPEKAITTPPLRARYFGEPQDETP